MASTLDELRANLELATQSDFRYKLLARGQSRAMIWRDGELPTGAPNYGDDLSEQLLSYGYSLLSQGLRYLEKQGDATLARRAFEVAGEAVEAVVLRGPASTDRGLHQVVAATAYHLGRYSARSYSLLHTGLEKLNLTPVEKVLAKLMLRDLDSLAFDIATWLTSGSASDEALESAFGGDSVDPEVGNEDSSEQENPVLEGMTLALEGNFLSAISAALLALERGDETLVTEAVNKLRVGLGVAGELNMVSQWWAHRIAVQLLSDLWEASFHAVLPRLSPSGGEVGDWLTLRKLFIATLHRRRRAEIELWPSQIRAAKEVLDLEANLVLSLPTSSGKTRIAELCILACLAQGKRVVFVTPLRALSAQTEVSLRRTFAPLGKTVSSLYGSIGVNGLDVDAMQTRHIVVSTPEKLDFALRTDPTLLDDIGLVVLDEGHMIGLGEREVRYEAQIQRLLRRPDAKTRRIVCLSAILPEGDQLQDFAAWLTHDKLSGLIKDDWRPTRLRFGEVDWQADHAQLNIVVGDQKPFVRNFLTSKTPTKGSARKTFPSDQTELCIATAWRLMDEGQTVLVFCPLRVSVMPFARRIIEMHKRGHLESVLEQPLDHLATAIAVGAEWFGADHDILACLKLGVAVHHGELPSAYRKEVERLLREGTLRLTVSSPTLAQGLNLAATSLVFHGIKRNRNLIEVSEFRNVVGRAGRAYVDVEGLVLYPIFDDHRKRRSDWEALVSNVSGREMESGFLRLLMTLLLRMAEKIGNKDIKALSDYVVGQGAWEFPMVTAEPKDAVTEERSRWNAYLASLDTAILSLLGEEVVVEEDVESRLDDVLASSLFARRIERRPDGFRALLKLSLASRSKFIWANSTPAQRRGYFLAGIGLESGRELDRLAPELELLLLSANSAIDAGDSESAISSITSFAEIAFNIPTFTPNKLPASWREVLRAWLSGQPLPAFPIDDSDAAVSLIEHAFVYNLPWAMEAVRVRAEAHEDLLSDKPKLSDCLLEFAVSAVETGTLSIAAATLIKAGFGSRLGAIRAIEVTGAKFESTAGLKAWLASEQVRALGGDPNWPSAGTHSLWRAFLESAAPESILRKWSVHEYIVPVKWRDVRLTSGTPVRFGVGQDGKASIFTADYREVGTVGVEVNNAAVGIAVAAAYDGEAQVKVEYIGPEDLFDF